MKTVTMSATIPVAQYANIQPTFEVEAETHEEAMAEALAQMKAVWDRTAAKPLDIGGDTPRTQPKGDLLHCWASGAPVYFDPINHIYDAGDGKPWLSGSAFAGRYKSEFNAPLIAGKMADKHGVNAQDILAMWALNAEASSTFGTAVHAALQLRGEYANLSRKVKGGELDSALTKNPVLRPIVEAFFDGREDENARYEVFVADPVRAHCGLIDRLVVDPDGLVVEDYKTNTDLDKAETIKAPFKGLVPSTKLGAYWLQLSFYARILESHGQTVKQLRIHHLVNGKWITHVHAPIDLIAALTS